MKKIFITSVCIMLATFSTGCSNGLDNLDPTKSETGNLKEIEFNTSTSPFEHYEDKPTGLDEEKGYLPIYSEEELDKVSEKSLEQAIAAKFTDKFEVEYLEDWNIESPQGILCRENDIVIADKKENCLFVKDYEGNTLQTIGKSGNGNVEFLSPSALATENGKIYIFDAGNNRIQILTEEFAYVDEIFISYSENINLGDYSANLAVDRDETVYFTLLTPGLHFVVCYEKGSKDAIELGRNFIGRLTASGGVVYAVSIGSVYTGLSETGVRNGYTILYRAQAGGMTKLCKLPNSYYPIALLMQDGEIICLSSYYGRLDILNLEGEYQETICEVGSMREAYISMGSNGDYYISDTVSNRLIRVKRP